MLHIGNEVRSCVGGRTVMMELCVFWLSGSRIFFVGLLVDFWLTSSGQSTLHCEWGWSRHRMVLLGVWCDPSLLA